MDCSANGTSSGALTSLWDSFKEISLNSIETTSTSLEETSNSSFAFLSASSESSTKIVNWMIENRGGMAQAFGLLLVPAQFIGKNYKESKKVINDVVVRGRLSNASVEKISINLGDNETLSGVICYPIGWDKSNKSECIVYHNPNGIALASYFNFGSFSYTASEFFEIRKCPIILYDYRGVGLNQTPEPTTSLSAFHATYESIVVDGTAALNFALSQFDKVEVMGSSLGGGVATASLDRYLNQHPKKIKCIKQLVNHDSFTTTPRVVFTSLTVAADALGYLVGAHLDAMTPMKKLIDKGVRVTVLCHLSDPVIPAGARMAEYVGPIKDRNVTVFNVDQYGHADLSSRMIDLLTSQNDIFQSGFDRYNFQP